ncbi:MAG: ArsR/SmtB family transcription factor [Candidatus Thorarchaeota archaeon]
MPDRSGEKKTGISLCGGISDSACYASEYSDRKNALDDFCSIRRRIDTGIFTSGVRLGILLLLLKLSSACVCEMQYALDEPRQSLISHHLRALKKKGWLQSEKFQKWTFYSIPENRRKSLSAFLKG